MLIQVIFSIQVWSRLLSSGTFWMGLLLLIVVINGKDVYMCALGRSFDPKPYHVIQEVRCSIP